MAIAPGARLGSYEIIAAIGAGGMGEVYRARDTTLGREVAIKVLPAEFIAHAERRARFEREALLLASLNHPNIATIHGIEHVDGEQAIVLELIEGETLRERLIRGPLPLADALRYAIAIADALDAAHEKGVIHRDLKPGNIKITPAGTVKVLDFGLAKVTGDDDAAPDLTQSLTILGTAAYMSPEQARGHAVDKRADIWAFGCVLYEMFSGRRAFEGDDVSVVMASIIKSDPDWKSLPATIPVGVRIALQRCLQKDPRRRLRDIGDMRLALEGAFEVPADERVARTARERLAWKLAALAIVAAVVVSGVSIAYLRQRPQSGAMVRFTVAPPFGATRSSSTGRRFAVSPNGQTIAFRADGAGGVGRIFTRRFDQTDAYPVAGTDNANRPFWSPDSRSLGFSKEGALYITDLDGSAPRRLCDVPGGSSDLSSGTWGTRGVIVFASTGTGLWRVPDTGGTPTPVTSLDAANKEASHASPWFLPDGRHVLFLALASMQSRGVIWAVSVDDSQRTRIVESSGGAAYADGWLLTTTAAPRGLVAQAFDPERLTLGGAPQLVRDRLVGANTGDRSGFSVSLKGALAVDRPPPVIHQLTWMDRVGRVLGTIGPAAAISDFGLAPDERRVVAGVTDAESLRRDLWLFDPQREEGIRLTFQGGATRPMWDLDGRHVYFSAVPSFELRSLRVGASEPERFENPGGFIHFQDVTRDGRYLVFKFLAGQSATIWIQRVGAPGQRRVLVQSQFFASQARVSPDGRWLAYTLSLPRGPEVFLQPFDRPGDRFQVSRTGGSGAIWRADSRELYYEGTDGLMAVAMTERSGTLDVGTPRKLFSLHTQGIVTNQPHNVEVAANGQRFLVNAIVGNSDNVPIEVTLNWTAGLSKKD